MFASNRIVVQCLTVVVRGKRDMNKVPKYVRESMRQGNDMIIRDYATSTFETLHGFPRRDEEKPDVLTILNLTADQLLEYYLELNEKEPCPLTKIFSGSFSHITQQNEADAHFICAHCPGTDLLNSEDIGILFQYTSFANLWLDALWDQIHLEDGPEEFSMIENDSWRFFSDFISHFYENVGSSLRGLNLDIVEYAVLKSFVIWKLGVVDFSTTLKIVAQEHYLGTTLALTEYYKTEKSMDQFEIALRIADLTLLLAPIFNSYRELVKVHGMLEASKEENMEI
uniref:NR LBD domain-containing protein n=1 Tax=Caenorhabditis tropicalis TaxID=1561998 RepID=A0A1I7V3Y5_9PELO